MNISDIVAARRVKDPMQVEIIDGFDTIDLSDIQIDTHLAEPFDEDDDLHPWAEWEEQAEEETKPDLELSTACPQCGVDHWCSYHAHRAYVKRKVLAFRRRRAGMMQRVRG